jgi:DNA-directed RNA polymerase subunit M/transcription elongation factor TFIIS
MTNAFRKVQHMDSSNSANFGSVIARMVFCPDCKRLMEPLKTKIIAYKCHYCRERWGIRETKNSAQAMQAGAEKGDGDAMDT